jgi:hypothetical protein
MASSGNLDHNPKLRSQVDNYDYVGENVGYGANAAQIHGALMNSAPHKANILDRDYRQIGVGAVRDSKGLLWIAQVFRDPAGSSARTPKPKSSSSAKPRSSTKPKAKAKPKPKPEVRTSSSSGDATAPKPAARPAAPAPKRVAAPAVPTLADRWQEVQQWGEASKAGDPLVTTMMFTRAMDTLAS